MDNKRDYRTPPLAKVKGVGRQQQRPSVIVWFCYIILQNIIIGKSRKDIKKRTSFCMIISYGSTHCNSCMICIQRNLFS